MCKGVNANSLLRFTPFLDSIPLFIACVAAVKRGRGKERVRVEIEGRGSSLVLGNSFLNGKNKSGKCNCEQR